MCAMRTSVVHVPTCARANVPKACKLVIFTCQRANKCANVPKACQKCTNFSAWPANVP